MNKLKFIATALIISLVFIVVAYLSYNLAEPKAYDYMTKNVLAEKLPFGSKRVHGSDDIVLVVIDAKTVEKYRWPWKRETYSKIFEYFINYGKPKAVVFDVLITVPDIDNPQSDKILYKTVSKMQNLIVGFMPSLSPWRDEKAGEKYDIEFSKKYGMNVLDKSKQSPNLYGSFLTMPEGYFNAAKRVGSVSIMPGSISGSLSNWSMDEIYRNQEYLFRYKGSFYPSLAFSTFMSINNDPEIVLTNQAIEFPKLGYKVSQKKTIYRTTAPLKFYKLYNNGYSHLKVSAIDVIDSYNLMQNGKKPILDTEIFKDKIIVVGANVPAGAGLNDNKNTPISVNHPGVDIQATAIDNIIHNDFIKVLPNWMNIFITIFGMLLVYCYIRVCTLLKSIFSTLFISFSYIAICCICFYNGIVINVITPIVMFVLTTILAYTHKFILENKSKEKVKSAMGKYISEDVMKRVIQDIDNLGLGGKKSIVTVLFSDIRGFTSMSEKLSAQEVSEILNEYFTEMEPIIAKYNGVINKFIGDAVMAIFGEPIQDKNHAQNAVKCAYAMHQKVKELQKKWVKEGKPKIEIGIGINTGEVFVGNIGSVNRMEYTVIGDTVNLASRLESYNKIYKTKLLISPSTYEEVKGFVDVIKISDVQIRGKANKMDIYEVLKVINE